MLKERLSSGFCITPTRENSVRSEPASVRLHKMGGTDTAYLTPSEAKLLANALISAAMEAEGSS